MKQIFKISGANKPLVILLLISAVCILEFSDLFFPRKSSSYGASFRKTETSSEFSRLMRQRRETVSRICDEAREELSWSQTELEAHMRQKYIWDLNHRLVFCPISKVASTSWILNFLAMAGVTEENLPAVLNERSDEGRSGERNWEGRPGGRGIHSLAYHLYPAPSVDSLESLKELQSNHTGFMVVRHPFVRLVSAYEDKMLNPHPYPYELHHKIQRNIKRRRNKNQTIDFPKELLETKPFKILLRKNPSFSEFVDWLIADRERKDSSYLTWPKNLAWIPFHVMCPVCQNDFDILKMDTEGNEIQQFIEEQRLPIKSSAKIHTKGGVRNSAEKVEEYFSALTAHQVKGLGDIYKYDFQMFGYDYQRYLRNISL